MKDFIIITETEFVIFSAKNIQTAVSNFRELSKDIMLGICEIAWLEGRKTDVDLLKHIGLS